MKKYLFILLIPLWLLVSCSNSDEPFPSAEISNGKTLIIYMPWSSNLTGYFYQNIRDMEACIERMGGIDNERVIVFISTSSAEASLFEITFDEGACQRVDLKTYSSPAVTTETGITEILNDVISFAPAKRYSMIIGCHGMGWLPVNAGTPRRSREKLHWEYEDVPLTRYFGGTTSEHQTEISTLAAAIENTGVKMEYILFDDCYMSTIEVAYELKDVADYLIASTCEVMAYGMPYATMGEHLLGTPDYKAVCDEFYKFYSNYTYPWGTLSVTDLSYIEEMAALMRQINRSFTFDDTGRSQLQNLDGYTPTIFYDYGDYVNMLLEQNQAPENLKAEFRSTLSRLIPYKTNTEKFFTAVQGPLEIKRYSGITTSDPSVNPIAAGKVKTRWYLATH